MVRKEGFFELGLILFVMGMALQLLLVFHTNDLVDMQNNRRSKLNKHEEVFLQNLEQENKEENN